MILKIDVVTQLMAQFLSSCSWICNQFLHSAIHKCNINYYGLPWLGGLKHNTSQDAKTDNPNHDKI